MLEHLYFAYVYWYYGTTRLAMSELGVDDGDRRMAIRTTSTSKAGRVILGCLKGLSIQNSMIAIGLIWAETCTRHKLAEQLQLFFGITAVAAGINVAINVNFETGFRRLVIAVLVVLICSVDIFLDTITTHTGPGIKKGYWETD